MSRPFPSPTTPSESRAEVLLGYLDSFRDSVLAKLERLRESEQRRSRVTSGWTPLELVDHLRFVEMRWFDQGFEGQEVAQPWGDERAGRW